MPMIPPFSSEVRRAAGVAATEHELLQRVAAALIARDLDGPSHVMLYGHGAPAVLPSTVSAGDAQRLLTLAGSLVAGFEPHALLLSVRLLVAPPGYEPQGWHLDYRAFDCLATQTVFAALTPCTAENCTELLMPTDEGAAARLDAAVAEELLRAPADGAGLMVQVSPRQVVLQPLLLERFGVCCVPTGRLPHRRGPTLAAAHTRVVLNVDFTTCSPAKLHAIDFVDDDAFEAASSGGIVGRAVVDDLHSEVVVEIV